MRRQRWFAPVVSLVIAMSAMSGAASAGTVRAAAKIEKGGTLTYLVRAAPVTLDAAKGTNNTTLGLDIMFEIYGALVVFDRTSNDFQMLMAKSVTTPDSGKSWIINIRPNVKFTDGTPYDAAAVVAQWTRMKDPAFASTNLPAIQDMESFTATDALTVKVVLKSQNTQWLHTLQFPGLSNIASPTAVQKLGANYANNPVGAGPFMIKSVVQGSTWTLERNPTYWDAPRPYLDGIVHRLILDDSQRVQTFSSGQGDMVYSNNPRVAASLAAVPGAKQVHLPATSTGGVQLNTSIAPTNDIRVRKAIQLTLDAEQIGAAFGAKAQLQIWPKGSPYYDPNFKYPKRDLKAAQKLIDEYVAEKGDVRLVYDYPPAADLAAEVVKAQLERLQHVTVALGPAATGPAYTARVASNQLNITYNALPGDGTPEPVLYSAYHCPSSPTTYALNFGRYCNPEVDKLLEQARQTSSMAEQIKLYRELQRISVKDAAKPFGAQSIDTRQTFTSKVKAVRFAYDGIPRFDLIWMSQKN